jgi:hypothetical protein
MIHIRLEITNQHAIDAMRAVYEQHETPDISPEAATFWFIEGLRAGVIEMSAQQLEHGIDTTLEIEIDRTHPDDDD